MLKCAVVGAGYLGRFHAEKYYKKKNAELTAVVDLDSDRAKRVAKAVKANALTDYRQLPSLGVQCASVVTDTSRHFEVASWLIENGIDVLVEKPITSTVEEARILIEKAKEHDRILQVGHLERFNPAFQAVKELLTRPRFFEVRRIAPFSGRGADVDVIRDLMIHDIDIVAHLVGKPIAHIEALGIPVLTGSIDIANARVTFEDGAIANFTASRAAFKSERTIRMFQPNVYISLDFGNKKLKMYSRAGQKDEKGYPQIKVVEKAVEERDALDDEIRSFLHCVETRSRPEVSGEDGLLALELAQRIYKVLMDNPEIAGYINNQEKPTLPPSVEMLSNAMALFGISSKGPE